MKITLPAYLRLDVSTTEARQLQLELAARVVCHDQFGGVTTVAGADVSLHGSDGYAAVILYSFPGLREIERSSAAGRIDFPYVPGLLSFREVPLLLRAFAKLRRRPDLIIVDGHGIAHPRRAGLASFLGLALHIPTIGSAKSLLTGRYSGLASEQGSSAPLLDGSERLGTVLRTRHGVRPLFISIGHRISLRTAVRFVVACGDGYRLPKPQREADLWTRQLRRAAGPRQQA